ncbi:pirin family protein [Hyphomonas sp.]|jgi:redox-sensitive bicupin YhaK (pirin superfamily)|uniref:pirin family protein n=1 Tax=Hyphomonas sp. TaxID=87 RepID=UPI0037BEA8A7
MTDLIIDKRRRDLGGGFEVGRVLPFAKRRMVEPFIFFDQMGPFDFAPGIPHELDVRPHPHIGLSTVTYRYSGAVNWITAGKGITP